jgi:hypothetical protein
MLVVGTNTAPADAVREVIVRAVPIVGEGWRRPPPTTAELAAERDRQRILAQGREQLKACPSAVRRVPSA